MTSKPPLIIVGAGGLARSIYSVFSEQYYVIGFQWKPRKLNETIYGLPVQEQYYGFRASFAVGLCSNPLEKRSFIEQTDPPSGGEYINLFHPSATVSTQIRLGAGNVFMPHCHVDPEAEIGNFNTFMNGCFIGHNVRMGNYCTIGQNAVIGGFTKVEDEAYIGSNAVILNEHWQTNPIRLGKACQVGAGAVVVGRSVEDDETVVGIPAKPLKPKAPILATARDVIDDIDPGLR